MILTNKVKIIVNKRNLKHFKSLGLGVALKEEIEIEPKNLLRYNETIVKVKCDICGKESDMKYSHYNQNCDRNNDLYCCFKCRTIRISKTNLKKYGVENVSQAKQIKEKKKETNIKNWGTENVFQSEKIKEISRKTKKEKYENENFTNREKSKQTCFKNNGVEWPTQSKEVLQKRNLNNKNKWGVEHYQQTEECQEKIRKTCSEKYGSPSYLATKDCQIKSRQTCREKYGVDYPSQDIIIHRKQFPKMKMHEIGIKYQGSYEKDFLDLCQKNNLEVKRGKTIKYQYLNKERYYFSDFYIKKYNLVVEIKSWYIYDLHKERCIAKELGTISKGYNFILIMDKDYNKFLQIIS